MITAAAGYLTGLIILFLSSGIRACIPELTLSEGRDPSERRHAAIFHLGILWLMSFTGTVPSGVGAILLAVNISSYISLPYWVITLILAVAAFVLSVILKA